MEKMEEFNKSKKRFIINSLIMLFVLFGIAAYIIYLGTFAYNSRPGVFTLITFPAGILVAGFGVLLMIFVVISAILTFVAIMMANKKKKSSIVLSWINIVLSAIPDMILLSFCIETKGIMYKVIGIIILAVWILDIISTVKFGKALKQITEVNKVDNAGAKES